MERRVAKALILCAGKGSRLYPLTHNLPKGLVPVANKPIVVHHLEGLAGAGIRKIGLVVGDNEEQFKQVLGDGKEYGVELTYLVQRQPLGLAHAVAVGKDYVSDVSAFLVILGDNLYQTNPREFIEGYTDSQAETQVMLNSVEDPRSFGVATVEGSLITGLVEKPAHPLSNWAVGGLYGFTNRIFTAMEGLQPSRRGELELTDTIQRQIQEGWSVQAYFADGYWYDIGNIDQLLLANHQVLSVLGNEIEGKVDDQCQLTPPLTIGSGSRLINSLVIGPALLGTDCMIENCHIGPGVVIGNRVQVKGCTITNSVVMDDTVLRNVAGTIGGSVIGRKVTVQGGDPDKPYKRLILGDHDRLDL